MDCEEEKYKGQHQCWLRQLVLEYDDICFSYKVHLRPPVFEISGSKSKLGEWDAATRTIRISRNLIIEKSWSVVIHVLKHEMAHQYCSEMMHGDGMPHGEGFQLACERLGVPAEYRTARSTLHGAAGSDGFAAMKVERGRKFLIRLEKLLALSHSGNEHEAALAMQKARELARKYHCNLHAAANPSNFTYLVIDNKRKRFAGYQRYICMILNDFFMVRLVVSDRYDALVDDTFKVIEIMGTRENLAIAEYCYYFLENQLKILWQVNKKRFDGKRRRSMQNSYYLGVLHGFSEHLKQHQKQHPVVDSGSENSGLIEIREGMLNEYVAMRFPRLRRSSSRRLTVKTGAFEKGVESGRELRFTHGVEQNSREFGGYLDALNKE